MKELKLQEEPLALHPTVKNMKLFFFLSRLFLDPDPHQFLMKKEKN
jgi:hypothetical protein